MSSLNATAARLSTQPSSRLSMRAERVPLANAEPRSNESKEQTDRSVRKSAPGGMAAPASVVPAVASKTTAAARSRTVASKINTGRKEKSMGGKEAVARKDKENKSATSTATTTNNNNNNNITSTTTNTRKSVGTKAVGKKPAPVLGYRDLKAAQEALLEENAKLSELLAGKEEDKRAAVNKVKAVLKATRDEIAEKEASLIELKTAAESAEERARSIESEWSSKYDETGEVISAEKDQLFKRAEAKEDRCAELENKIQACGFDPVSLQPISAEAVDAEKALATRKDFTERVASLKTKLAERKAELQRRLDQAKATAVGIDVAAALKPEDVKASELLPEDDAADAAPAAPIVAPTDEDIAAAAAAMALEAGEYVDDDSIMAAAACDGTEYVQDDSIMAAAAGEGYDEEAELVQDDSIMAAGDEFIENDSIMAAFDDATDE